MSKWMSCVKAVKTAIANKGVTYSQEKYVSISVNGKTISTRRDCSGYVSACLAVFGAFETNYRTNSTGFSHSNAVAKKLTAAGFTKKAWSGWDALEQGCIISDDYSHVEIFDHSIGNTHWVWSNGSTTGLRTAGVTKDGGSHKYDAVWFPPKEKSNAPEVAKPVLKRRCKSDEVRKLQKDLNWLGADLSADGSFGPATETAVKSWQSKNGLSVDGIYGPASYRKMQELLK